MDRTKMMNAIVAEGKRRGVVDETGMMFDALLRMGDMDLAAFAYTLGLENVVRS